MDVPLILCELALSMGDLIPHSSVCVWICVGIVQSWSDFFNVVNRCNISH